MLALFLVGCGGPTPAELLDDARQAIADGAPRTAEIHLKNLLVAEPENGEGRRLLGEVSLSLGQSVAAEAQLRRAVEVGVDPAVVQVSLLWALVGQGKFAEAVAEFESGPSQTGAERVAALQAVAAAHTGLGSLDAAENAYREALALGPQSAAVRTQLAATVLEAGRADEARAMIAAVLDAEPEFVPALITRGRLELVARQLDAAEATFREVLRLESTAPSGSYATGLAALVEVLLARGSIDEAAVRTDELLALAPEAPYSLYLKASVEAAQGDLGAAEARLEAVVAQAPDNALANRLLGLINAEQGQFGQAEMYMQAAVANAPANPQLRTLLARIYLRQGKLQPAREVLAGVFPATESDAVMFALAGSASLGAGDTALAAEYFEQSEQSAPETIEQRFGLASVYAAAGEYGRAVRALESGDYAEAENAAQASFMLALVHLADGDFKSADEAATRLAEQAPDKAWPLALRGAIATRSGDLAQAREQYSAALAIEPEHVTTLMNLARTEAQLGNLSAAAEVLERAVRVAPEQAVARLWLAELAIRNRDDARARDWIDSAPDSAGRLQLEGMLALAQGRTADAADAFSRLFERQPSAQTATFAFATAQRAGRRNPEAALLTWLEDNPRDVQANFTLGTITMDRGQQAQAVPYFETAVEANPDHAPSLNNLAWLYQQQGDARALDTAVRAYEAAPQSAAIADTLGWLHVTRGDAAAGLPFLEQAVQGDSAHPEIRYHLAVALAETGDSDAAVAALERALGDDAQFDGRADAERLLAALKTP
jgi:putative PEP-CTERM system TPR-repeat lipoprotein